jgi:hypothetical protein
MSILSIQYRAVGDPSSQYTMLVDGHSSAIGVPAHTQPQAQSCIRHKSAHFQLRSVHNVRVASGMIS